MKYNRKSMCTTFVNENDELRELVDARKGYDGTTYPTAGEAVRRQAANLQERIDEVRNGNLEQHSVSADKMAWLEYAEVGKEETQTELFDGLIDGYIESDGSIFESANYKRTDFIPVAEYEKVELRITAFTCDTTERSLYIARYDADMNFIAGTRTVCNMYGLNADGTVNINETGYTSSNLCLIGQEAAFSYGMGIDISADDYGDGTAYIVLFNLRVGDSVDMRITGFSSETVNKYVVPEEMLPEAVTKLVNETIPSMEQSIENADRKATEALAKAAGVDAVKAGGVNDHSLAASKMAWLNKTSVTTEVGTELFDGLIAGYVEADGTIPNYSAYRATDYIPLVDYKRCEFRITAFTTPATERMLWCARYDKDKNFIAGSRQLFQMYGLNADGTLNINETGYTAANLYYIGTTNGFEYGMGIDISASDYDDGTAYIVLYNLYAVDSITMSISGVKDEQGYEYSVPEEMLPEAVTKLVNETIPELEGILASGSEIPVSDYVPELVEKVALAAKAHMKPDSMCLVLYTDTHYVPSRTVFPTVIAKMLAESTNATAIVHLGDLADMAKEGKAEGVKIWQQHSNILHAAKIPYLQIVGNHDDASYYNRNVLQDRSAENYLTASDLFFATSKQSRRDISMGSVAGGYYYMDDEDSKTRLIVLNSHEYPWVVNEDGTLAHDSSAANVETGGVIAAYSPAQLDWLANIALDFSDKGDAQGDWSVLAFAHLGDSNWYNVNTLFQAFKKGTKYTKFSSGDLYNLGYNASTVEIKTDFSQVGARKIAFLVGDVHADLEFYDVGYPQIKFLNASPSKDHATAPTKTAGTPTETAISVLVVTPSENKITELRFGAGTRYDGSGNALSYDPLMDYDNYRVFNY